MSSALRTVSRLNRVNDDVEALAGSRRDEIAGEQIVVRFADLERVLAASIALLKPPLADRVWDIEQMKLVGHPGLSDHRTHPVSLRNGVGWKIENNRKALLQDIDDVRGNRSAKPCGETRVVAD